MKSTQKKEIIHMVVWSEEEARWLRNHMQNPLNGDPNPANEDPKDADMRKKMWEALSPKPKLRCGSVTSSSVVVANFKTDD